MTTCLKIRYVAFPRKILFFSTVFFLKKNFLFQKQVLLTISLVWLFSLFIVAPPYLFGWGRGEGGGGGGEEEEKVVCTIPQVRQSEKVSKKECQKGAISVGKVLSGRVTNYIISAKTFPYPNVALFYLFTFLGCSNIGIYSLLFFPPKDRLLRPLRLRRILLLAAGSHSRHLHEVFKLISCGKSKSELILFFPQGSTLSGRSVSGGGCRRYKR